MSELTPKSEAVLSFKTYTVSPSMSRVEVHAESFDAGGGEVVHAIWEAAVGLRRG